MSMSTKRRLASGISLLSAAVFACGVVSSARAGAKTSPIVYTNDGAVQGFVNTNGVTEYLGIPYAAPPVGDLRWRPPHAASQWTTVRPATGFGPTCAQITELGVFAGPANSNEDCLYLNVFTTNPGDTKSKKPVMMWIHGGGLVDGESNDYDASKLTQGGPGGATVIVTINYRLGLLGYLAHPALDAEGHPFGNYGLMDQQAALRWIRANIAAFGGDPNNVTVGGQSAGSTSTAANVLSPASAGLFHRAILESGALLTAAPLSMAESRGSGFAAAAGCGTDASAASAKCLRKMSVPAILNLSGTPAANGPYINGLMVDGTLLPLPPDTAFATGKFNKMPIMSGTVEDEGAFTASIHEYFYGPLTSDEYTTLVTATYSGPEGPGGSGPNYPPGTVAAVLAHYPVSAYASPSLAYVAEQTDPTACKQRHLDRTLYGEVPVYAYEFDDRSAPWYFPKLSFPHGAAHTIDIQFLFNNWHGGSLGIAHPLNEKEEHLSAQLVGAWTSFMYSGNPNLIGNTPWPKYSSKQDDYLSEKTPRLSVLSGSDFTKAHQCAFWDSVLIY